MKKLKRLFITLVAVLMVLTYVPTKVWAETDALPEADANGVITLIENVTLASRTNITSDTTLDLNGHTLTYNGVGSMGAIYVNSSSTLTIKDSGENGGIIANGSSYNATGIKVDYNSTVNMQGGKLTVNNSISGNTNAFFIGSGSTLNMTGGSVEFGTVTTSWSGPNFYGVNNSGIVNISGGTISVNTAGVNYAIYGGTVNVSGGTVIADNKNNTGNAPYALYNASSLTVTGGLVKVLDYDTYGWSDGHFAYGCSNANITGGTFYSVKALDVSKLEKQLSSDYELQSVGENTYEVVEKATYVAQIGNDKYESLADAIDAANSGDTIELLDNIVLTEADANPDDSDWFYIGKSITLDGNGFTISASATSNLPWFFDIYPNQNIVVNIHDLNFNLSGIQSAIVPDMDDGCDSVVVNLENVNVTTNGEAVYSNGIGSVVNATNCTFTHDGNFTRNDTSDCYDAAVLVGYGGIVNLTNCTVNSSDFGVATFPSGSTINLYNTEVNLIENSTAAHVYTYADKSAIYVWTDDSYYDNLDLRPITASSSIGIYDGSVINGNLKLRHQNNTSADRTATINAYAGAKFTSISPTIHAGSTLDETDGLFVQDGYKFSELTEGYYEVVSKYVAQIDNVQYETLQEAFNDASTDDTITLIKDVTYGTDKAVDEWVDKAVNLDLNGHTLTTNSEVSVTLSNMGYKASALCYSISSANAGEIKISNGEIVTAYGAGVYADDKGLTVTLENLTINANTVAPQQTNEYSSAVRITSGAKVIINSGSYTGYNAIAVSNSGGEFVINDGTFDGRIFFSSGTNSGVTKSITINGGSFKGEFVNPSKGTLTITGGKFSSDPTNYVAEGYEVKSISEDGLSYEVVKKVTYVAQIGETKYETLAGAVAAATNDDIITLLRDVELTDSLDFDTNKDLVIIDLNGHKISAKADAVANNKFAANSLHDYLIGVKYNTYLQIVDSVGGGSIDASNLLVGIKLTIYGETAGEDDCAALTVGDFEENNNNFTITGGTYGISGNGNRHQTTLEVFGGTIIGSDGTGIFQPQAGSINIKGGTIKGKESAIEIRSTDEIGASITGGTFAVTGSDAYSVTKNGSGTTTKGAAIAIAQHTTNKGVLATIDATGCTFDVNANQTYLSVADPEGMGMDDVTVYVDDVEGAQGLYYNYEIPAGYGWYGSAEHDEYYTLELNVAEVLGNNQHVAYYSTLEDAFAEATDGQTIKLLSDIALTERLFVNAGANPAYAGTNNRYATTSENKAITLDLNGHNITSSSNIALAGGSLNITGTGTISTTTSGLAPIEVRGTGDLTSKRTLTIGENVVVDGTTGKYGINIFGSNDAQKNIIDVTINGTVKETVFVLGNLKNAENEINIVVNGKVLATKSADASSRVGIALNGNANVKVYTSAEIAGDSGIEVRAGSLIVNGGTITALADAYSYTPNGSGSTTKGAAIAVAQHTTALPINVNISGGTINGVTALSIVNPENNTVENVKVVVSNGNFIGEINRSDSRVKAFIKGGKYSVNPSAEYVVEGYEAASIEGETLHYQVGIIEYKPTIYSGDLNSNNVVYTTSTNVVDTEDSNNILNSNTTLTVNVTGTLEETTNGLQPSVAVIGLNNISDANTLSDIVSTALKNAGNNITSTTTDVNVEIRLVKSEAKTTTDGKVTYDVRPEAFVKVGDAEVGSVEVKNSQLSGEFSFKLYARALDGVEVGDQIIVNHVHDEETNEMLGVFTVDSEGYITITGITSFSDFVLEEYVEASTTDKATFTYQIQLQDSINIIFHAKDLEDSDLSKYSIAYGKGESIDKTWTIVTPTSEEDNEYVIAECAAKEMTDEYHVIVTYDGTVIKNAYYSIKKYCDTIINNASNYNDALVNLCKATLDYGRYAQETFNYNIDNLANGGENNFDIEKIVVPPTGYTKDNQNADSILGVGASLTTTSKTKLNIYFESELSSLDGYTIEVNGNAYNNAELLSDGKIKITVSGIAAKELDNKVIVKITDPYKNYYSISISPVDYMGYIANRPGESQVNVNKAFYNYFCYADSYFG